MDHNVELVAAARALGFRTWTTAEWPSCPDARPAAFESLLLSHLVEHLDEAVADEIMRTYLPFVRPGGLVHLITPQERGQASDPTHVRFCDEPVLRNLASRHGLAVERVASFPLPRWAGRAFVYNEFHLTARLPG